MYRATPCYNNSEEIVLFLLRKWQQQPKKTYLRQYQQKSYPHSINVGKETYDFIINFVTKKKQLCVECGEEYEGM